MFSVCTGLPPLVATRPGHHLGSAPACLTAYLRTRPERDCIFSHHSQEVVYLDPTRHSGSEACALDPQLATSSTQGCKESGPLGTADSVLTGLTALPQSRGSWEQLSPQNGQDTQSADWPASDRAG